LFVRNKTLMLSALVLGSGTALGGLPARADEISDLKALVNELKAQVRSQNDQVQSLRAQVDTINNQVSDQGAQVQQQGQSLQKVETKQLTLEQQKQQQQTAETPGTGKPGYFQIPGTRTGLKLSGYVKLDAYDDIKGNFGDSAATNFAAIPRDGSTEAHRNGRVALTAQETRLKLESSTDTDQVGEVKTVVEGDFYGSGNVFRLRHAYVTGAGWTAGQTWTTFADLDSGSPETLEFNGPVGWTALRQAQLRYSTKAGPGTLDLAIEAPSSDLDGTNVKSINRAPDLVARYSDDTSWGHYGVAALGRYLSSDAGVANQRADALVYGLLAGAKINIFGKDALNFQAIGGNGIVRYLEQGNDVGKSAVLVNNTIKPIEVWGGTIGYAHFWTDALRSNVAYGYEHFSTPSGGTSSISSLSSVHANLIWSPIEHADVGIEYIYGQLEASKRTTDSNGSTADHGSAHRVQTSVKYSF